MQIQSSITFMDHCIHHHAKRLLFVLLVVVVTQCNVRLASNYTATQGKGSALSYSWSGASSYFASITKNKNKYGAEVVMVSNNTIYSSTPTSYSVNFNSTFNLRNIADNSVFLVYDSTNIKRYNNNFTNSTIIFTAPIGNTILDAHFWANNTQILVILKSISGYFLKLIENTTVYKTITLTAPSNATYKKLQISGNTSYLFFNTGIYAYYMNMSSNTLTLTWQKLFTPISSVLPKSSMSVFLNLLAYSQGSTLSVIDTLANHSLVYNYTDAEAIVEVAIIQSCYVLVCTATKLHQVDIDIGVIIHSLSASLGTRTIGKFLSRYFAFHAPKPNSSSYIDIYQMTDYYYCGYSGTPLTTYYKFFSYCLKNYTYTFTSYSWYSYPTYVAPPPINASYLLSNSSTVNPTINPIINNATMNTSSPVNSSNSTVQVIPYIPINSSSTLPQQQQTQQEDIPNKISQVIGKALLLSSIKVSPNFLVSFLLLLDDFEYYQYHRCTYPHSAKMFMSRLDIINTMRLNPQFFSFVQALEEDNLAQQENTIALAKISQHDNNPDEIYFLHSTRSIYVGSLIANIFILLVARTFALLLGLLARKFNKLDNIHGYLMASTRWWSLIVAVIETNLVKLAFCCSLQVLVTGYNCYLDIVNMILMVLGWKIVILYSLAFYPIVYLYSDKRSASLILVRSFYSFNSFYLESFCVLLRGFTRAFFHAILLQNYVWQIASLTISDLFFIIVSGVFYKYFLNKFVFFFFVLYQFVLLLLDSLFLFASKFPVLIDPVLYDQAVFIMILCVIAISILMSLAILCTTLYDLLSTNTNVFNKRSGQKSITNLDTKVTNKKMTKIKQNDMQIPVQLSNGWKIHLDGSISVTLSKGIHGSPFDQRPNRFSNQKKSFKNQDSRIDKKANNYLVRIKKQKGNTPGVGIAVRMKGNKILVTKKLLKSRGKLMNHLNPSAEDFQSSDIKTERIIK